MKRVLAAGTLLMLLWAANAPAENLPPFRAEPPGAADLSGFKLKTLGGAPAALADFRGKVLLLNLASTWCAPCYAEMPALGRLHSAYGPKGLAVVTVLVHNGGAAKAKKFAQKTGVRFPIFVADGTDVMKQLGLTELPVSYILDRTGKPVAKVTGAVAWDGPETTSFFDTALKQ